MQKGRCVDCGGPTSRRETIRCNVCYQQYRAQKKARPHPCLDCKKEVTRLAKRCPSCAHKGWHPFAETRKRMSESRTGRRHSPEAINNMKIARCEYYKSHPHPWIGRHHALETREKMHQLWSGRPRSGLAKVNNSLSQKRFRKTPYGQLVAEKLRQHHLGLKCSEDTREKMSRAHAGPKNANYVHGMAKFPYPPDFSPMLKRQIRKRDNYCCQVCGMLENGYQLHPHHIDYCKTNNDPINLICLCRRCHTTTNYHRRKWKAYFQASQRNRLI